MHSWERVTIASSEFRYELLYYGIDLTVSCLVLVVFWYLADLLSLWYAYFINILPNFLLSVARPQRKHLYYEYNNCREKDGNHHQHDHHEGYHHCFELSIPLYEDVMWRVYQHSAIPHRIAPHRSHRNTNNSLIVLHEHRLQFHQIIIKITVRVLGGLLALRISDINPWGLAIGIGLTGYIAAFTLRNVLENLASGIFMRYFGETSVGDIVGFHGIEGRIKSIGLIKTTLEDCSAELSVVKKSLESGDNSVVVSSKSIDEEGDGGVDDSHDIGPIGHYVTYGKSAKIGVILPGVSDSKDDATYRDDSIARGIYRIGKIYYVPNSVFTGSVVHGEFLEKRRIYDRDLIEGDMKLDV